MPRTGGGVRGRETSGASRRCSRNPSRTSQDEAASAQLVRMNFGRFSLLAGASRASSSLRRRAYAHVTGQPPHVLVAHPFDLQVVEEFAVVHSETAPLRDARSVGLNFRREIRILEAVREEFLPFAELPDMNELMDHIEVDVPPTAGTEVVRRDKQMPVFIADSHEPPPRGEELDLEGLEDALRPRAEDRLDRRDVFEPLEMFQERVVLETDNPRNSHIRKFRLDGLHGFPLAAVMTRRASWLCAFGSTRRYAARIPPSGPTP